jgi:hypothetical protein
VSFVLPCLDEAETLEACLEGVRRTIRAHDLDAEIIVADNGSRDASVEIATRCGARVVHVAARGYGAALRGGFAAARGRYLVMGDADQSYDFAEAWPMIERLRAGADVVMGSRFAGAIEPGAMPWTHRWLGNPVLSFLGRRLFRAPVSDFHCGLRALRRDTFERLRVRTLGMEFASELVVKASSAGMRIEESPVTLHPDGRSGAPHLRTWRDGWRHLRFMLILSPGYTLFAPGVVVMLLGALLLARLALGPLDLGFATLDVHSMLIASLLVIVGYQAATTAIAAQIFSVAEELGRPSPRMWRAFEIFTLERGLLAGALIVAGGLAIVGWTTWDWARAGLGPLVPSVVMRPLLVGATAVAVGVQTLLMSFLYSMLGIRRQGDGAVS